MNILRRFDVRIAWGLLLIGAGVLFLLQNLGILGGRLNFIWASLAGLAGLFFLYVFAENRLSWWALIPGIILLSLAASILLGETVSSFAQAWGGSIFLGGIGLSFWAVYLVRRENWWAIIPGGVMLTLAAIAGLDSIFARGGRRFETGGVLFIGLGLTFALVGVLPTPRGRMRWAFIPAAVLLAMGLVIFAAAESLLKILGPVALILFGLYLFLRTLRPRQGP